MKLRLWGEVTRRGHSERCRNRIEEAMKNDESDKKKLEKAAERMTHKIAKDIENTDRKRKIGTRVGGTDGAAGTGSDSMIDTEARGSQEENPEREGKKVRFNSEIESVPAESGMGESMEALDGSTDGAAVPGPKRRRDPDDQSGRGMDIDLVMEESPPSGGAHGSAAGGSSAESFVGRLLRFSEIDPDVEQWAREVNQSRGREKTAAPHNGGADGATVAGKPSQINAVDVMEVYSPPRVTVEAKKFGLKAGEALDLVTGYDFSKVADRNKVWEIINRDQPAFGSGITRMQNVQCAAKPKQLGQE